MASVRFASIEFAPGIVSVDEEAELDDLAFRVVRAQGVEERGIDGVRVGRHQLAVAQRELVGGAPVSLQAGEAAE
jgi:hypothetical protein